MSRAFTAREWQALADHVAGSPDGASQSSAYHSTFNAAVSEARLLTRRDLKTGRRTGDETPTLWAGTLVYIVLLEQIGKTLRPARSRDVKGESEVERALRQFAPKTTKRQREAVYGLRNAFAHDFGLFNPGRKDGRYRYAFALDDEPGQRLVRWPRRRWDGVVLTSGRHNRTIVNLVTLGDLCEEVVRSVRSHSVRQTLRCRCNVSELQRRYGFWAADNLDDLP